MLTVRMIGQNGYSVSDDGQRIRFASERNPGVWIWHVQSPHSRSAVRLRRQPR